MIFYILSFLPYLLQLLLIIHCIKTGRSGWLWLLVFLPYIGGIAYIILNIIPDMKESNYVHKAGNAIVSTFRPNKKIKDLEHLVKIQETVANITLLADAYAEAGNYQKAEELYLQCLSGPYEHDESIEFKLVKVNLDAGNLDKAKIALQNYKENHKIQNSEQALIELRVNEDFEKMEDIFANTGNFAIGCELARHYCQINQSEEVVRIVDKMSELRKDYPQLKKGQNGYLYRQAKSYLR